MIVLFIEFIFMTIKDIILVVGIGLCYLIFSAVESKKNTRYFDDGIPSASFYFPNKSLCVPVRDNVNTS